MVQPTKAMNTIYITSEGIFAAQLPEEPCLHRCESSNYCLDTCYRYPEYEQALATALLPENLVRFEDQEGTRKLLYDDEGFLLQLSGTYPVPSGYEIVIQWQVKGINKYWFDVSEIIAKARKFEGFDTRRVAVLRKKGEKKIPIEKDFQGIIGYPKPEASKQSSEYNKALDDVMNCFKPVFEIQPTSENLLKIIRAQKKAFEELQKLRK